MKLIAADHDRRYDLPGVSDSARRPVDIDASNTGFTRLRSLRLYRFEAGSVIDGHAEEDEVFVVVTSGSVEMKIGWEDSAVDAAGIHTLSVPTGVSVEPFVAYLPPHSAYQLTPHTSADVAYARATPVETRSPAVFRASPSATSEGVTALLDERSHAERLRLKVLRVRAESNAVVVELTGDADAGLEGLVHIQNSSSQDVGSVAAEGGSSLPLHSWDTLALAPGERPVLHAAPGVDLLVLMVFAA